MREFFVVLVVAGLLSVSGYYAGKNTAERRMQRACLAGEVVEIGDVRLKCRPPVIESSRVSYPEVIA